VIQPIRRGGSGPRGWCSPGEYRKKLHWRFGTQKRYLREREGKSWRES